MADRNDRQRRSRSQRLSLAPRSWPESRSKGARGASCSCWRLRPCCCGGGRSVRSVERQVSPLLAALAPSLIAGRWSLAPLVLVRQGRVAIGDSIAAVLEAGAVVVLIGERPGLSAPDSLGAYLTWEPIPERTTDADRNCISNIRPEGLGYSDAAFKLTYLLSEMRRREVSGVALKDDSGSTRLTRS